MHIVLIEETYAVSDSWYDIELEFTTPLCKYILYEEGSPNKGIKIKQPFIGLQDDKFLPSLYDYLPQRTLIHDRYNTTFNVGNGERFYINGYVFPFNGTYNRWYLRHIGVI